MTIADKLREARAHLESLKRDAASCDLDPENFDEVLAALPDPEEVERIEIAAVDAALSDDHYTALTIEFNEKLVRAQQQRDELRAALEIVRRTMIGLQDPVLEPAIQTASLALLGVEEP